MADKHEFAIAASELDAGGKAFSFAIRAGWMREALQETHVQTGVDDGTLELRLSRSGDDVVVRGSMRADLIVPCARCLEPASVVIREPLSALFVPDAAMRETRAGDDDGDLSPDQDDVIPYDGDTVVLDSLVRDELLLGIPMIPLCSEGCTGISPRSDEQPAEASIDPRLRPLLRLKKSTS